MGGRSRICEICGVRERKRGGFFANFPRDEQRCRIWVQLVGKEDLVHIPIEKLHDLRHVCGDHFIARDFNKKRNRLRKRAYPKLNLTERPLTAEQMKNFPLHMASDSSREAVDYRYLGQNDHCYTRYARPPGLTTGRVSEPPEPVSKPLEPNSELPEAVEFDASANDDPDRTSPDPDVRGAGIFSWQQTELIEADKPEAPAPPPEPTPPDRDPAPAPLRAPADPGPTTPTSDQVVPGEPAPGDFGNVCKECGYRNESFWWWCVQCGGGALCGACAARGPHTLHYVLRAPQGATYTLTQAVIAIIRQQLEDGNLLSQETVDDDMKVEVKEEQIENPFADHELFAEADPLAGLNSVELAPTDGAAPQVESNPPVESEPASALDGLGGGQPVTNTSDENREPTDASKEKLYYIEYRPVKSPAKAKRTFLIQLERIKCAQQKQLKLSQPPKKLTQILQEKLASNKGLPTCKRKFTDSTKYALPRGSEHQMPVKVTSGPKSSGTVIKDLNNVKDGTVEYLEEYLLDSDLETIEDHDMLDKDVETKSVMESNIETIVKDGTVEYLEEYLLDSDLETIEDHDDDMLDKDVETNLSLMESNIETIEDHDHMLDKDVETNLSLVESDIETIEDQDKDVETNLSLTESDIETIEDHDDDMLDEDYEINADDLDDLSGDDSVESVAGRGVKRKKVTTKTRDPCELMNHQLPSEAVVQLRPVSSLEINNWTADRKRLRKGNT